jgi:hypothetical protein
MQPIEDFFVSVAPVQIQVFRRRCHFLDTFVYFRKPMALLGVASLGDRSSGLLHS